MKNQDSRAFKISIINLNIQYLKCGSNLKELQDTVGKRRSILNVVFFAATVTVLILCILIEYGAFGSVMKYLLGIRCIIPNNYFVWEATRPISDCQFCRDVAGPVVLVNVTKEKFGRYTYSSKPIIVKKAVVHWPASTAFTYKFFKNLYDSITDAYQSVDDECQFLHFRSNFISLRDVFSMNEARINNRPGQIPWYVGWGNCHPEVLTKMRKYYPKPHFLPDDSEMPAKEYIFMGYDAGATMHLDFINRLMWQAQLRGTKTWYLKPTPECEDMCDSLSFIAEPGDIVLVDTRVWYHGTSIAPGEFSLAVQSEYG